MVAEILKSIKDALEKAQGNALAAYRTSSQKRHAFLKNMVPGTGFKFNKNALRPFGSGQECADAAGTFSDNRPTYG